MDAPLDNLFRDAVSWCPSFEAILVRKCLVARCGACLLPVAVLRLGGWLFLAGRLGLRIDEIPSIKQEIELNCGRKVARATTETGCPRAHHRLSCSTAGIEDLPEGSHLRCTRAIANRLVLAAGVGELVAGWFRAALGVVHFEKSVHLIPRVGAGAGQRARIVQAAA